MKLLKKNINPRYKTETVKITVIVLFLSILLTFFTIETTINTNTSQDVHSETTLLQLLAQIGSNIWPKVLPQIWKCDTPDNLSASIKTNESCNPTITDFVRKGESLYDIFKKNNIDMEQFLKVSHTLKGVFNPKAIKPYMSYHIIKDRSTDDIVQLRYAINGSTFLEVNKQNGEYKAETIEIPLEMKYGVISGKIKNSLLGSIESSKMSYNVLYDLSDIFAWDIDFTTDIKKGDSYKIIVEEFYSNGIFKHYGRILYAELKNYGTTHEAIWYEKGDIHGYFNAQGKALQKALTRAPLQFRHISSYFSYNRMHPILKIRRPHLGVDYAAPAGTPVSAAGDGVVKLASFGGQIGNHVVIKHPGGYVTNYGHLLRFAKGIHDGKKINQGDVIGYVGSTGLSSGPHLDYRVQLNNTPINPLTMKLPSIKSVPPKFRDDFSIASSKIKSEMATLYAGLNGFKNLKQVTHF